MNSEQITIDYYSDILCVWAWITQRRIDELNMHFDNKIEIRYLCVDIFGDTATRIQEQWADKGSYKGFSDHTVQSALPYDSAIVNPEVWCKTCPATSANAHLAIKAIEISHSKKMAIDFITTLRKAFFIDAKDIGDLEVIYSLAMQKSLDLPLIKNLIENGEALALLMRDYQSAKNFNIKGSPCFVMNQGRQILFGNVGFRVLRTNIEELLANNMDEASWC